MSAVAALNAIRFEVGFIIAPIIGGFIIAKYGASLAYLIDLITFIASLIAVWMIRAVPPPANADRPNLESIKKGFRYAMSRQELLGTYVMDINAMFFGMPKALFPALAVAFGAAYRSVCFIRQSPSARWSQHLLPVGQNTLIGTVWW